MWPWVQPQTPAGNLCWRLVEQLEPVCRLQDGPLLHWILASWLRQKLSQLGKMKGAEDR